MTADMTKQQRLEYLKNSIIETVICPELAATAKQLVFGEGSADAEIMFIGEAPGKQEDIQGKPFVGASGKLLNEMLESIEFDRSTVYITNIVKYRPPNNRDPLASEKEAFLPILLEQIEIINPKLIITLGRHSMNSLLPPGLIMGKVHGTLQKHQGRSYLPLYHPAAALYNGGLRQTLKSDFLTIPSLLRTVQ